MICVTFSMNRRLVDRGSTSTAVRTLSAIIAGSRFAIACLHVVLLWPCDNLLRLFPSVGLAKYVDDISITGKGPRGWIADLTVEATEYWVSSLELSLGMQVSRESMDVAGKSLVLTTHAGVEKRMFKAMAGMGLRFEACERYPGINCYCHGKRKGPITSAKRMRLMRLPPRRLIDLKKEGAVVRKVAVTASSPPVLYGGQGDRLGGRAHPRA